MIWPWDENLKLGKGAVFVKRDLRRLPLTDAEFEADFWLDPTMSTKGRNWWDGAVFERGSGALLASREFGAWLAIKDVDCLPTVNDLATMLAHAMSRPLNEGDRQRPHTIYLRDRPQRQELLPQLQELGIEVVTGEFLPTFDEAVVERLQREKPGGKQPSKEEVVENLKRPFPARKRTWHEDVFDFLKWVDETLKAAYPSRKVSVPSYDPLTVVPIQLAPEELKAILTQPEITRTKKLRPQLESMVGKEEALQLSVHDWGTVCLALCSAKVKEVQVRKHLFTIARKIAKGLSEALDIDGPPSPVN